MASSYGEMIAVNDDYARVGDSYFAQVTLGGFLEALVARFEADETFPRGWTPVETSEEDEEAAPEGQLTYNRLFRKLTGFLDEQGLYGESVLVLGESTSLYVFGNLF